QAQVLARAGDVGAAERAARLEVARAAVGSLLLDSVWGDPQWETNAIANTQSAIQKKVQIPGGYELTCLVTVYQKKLIEWGQNAGHGRRTESVSEDVPPPQIMIVPTKQAGKWPKELSKDESVIYTTLIKFLQSPPRNLQTFDYAQFFEAVEGELANATGQNEMDENYLIGGDLYLKYEYAVEPRGNNMVSVKVTIHGVNTVTGQNISAGSGNAEVPALQQTIGIERATLAAANIAVTQLLDTYNREYSGGVPYQIMLSGANDDIELDVSDVLQGACSAGKRLSNYGVKNGVIKCLLYAKVELGDPNQFRRYMRDKLADMGLKMVDARPRSRFIYCRLAPK
ncbi:MAG: hypothetical protein AB7S36_21710, partial [Planctomycetota bacterium]